MHYYSVYRQLYIDQVTADKYTKQNIILDMLQFVQGIKMTNTAVRKTNQPSRLKDLILLFAIPAGITVFAVVVVYTPRLFANPKYDFIYSVCSNYDCANDYTVDSSGYISEHSLDRDYYRGISMLRYYTAKDNATRNLTLEEAKRFQLNTSSKSLDGYSLTKENTESGFLFWGSSDSGWYLKNGAKKKEVELSANDSLYSQDIKFLGWINK